MSAESRPLVAVMHGVNLDQLGRRDPAHYGRLDLPELERRIETWAQELGFGVECFQTNYEGAFVEHLHSLRDRAAGLILNPGAWTHYAYAIHDALELTHLPAVEVHLSDVGSRESWRHTSVVRPLCVATVAGRGADGYHDALKILKRELSK